VPAWINHRLSRGVLAGQCHECACRQLVGAQRIQPNTALFEWFLISNDIVAMTLFRDSLLTIDFTSTGVAVAECMDDRVMQSANFSWPPQMSSTASPEAAGAWLGQQLSATGIATRKTVLVVPRQHVPLKLIDLPPVADDELAALVQMQAESRLSKPLDEFHFDFVPLPATEATSRRALLATVLRSVCDPMLALSKAAGLQVVGVTAVEVTLPIAVSSAAQCASSANTSMIDVAAVIAGDQSVLVASQLGRALGSLPVRLRGDDYGAEDDVRLLVSSSSRLLATIGTDQSAANLGAFTLCGRVGPALVAALQAQLGVPINRYGEQLPGSLVRLVAASHVISQKDRGINFLAPRRPVDQAAIKRHYYYRVGMAAAALFVFSGWTYWDQSQELDRDIAARKKELSQLNQLIERGQPIVETTAFLGDWQRGQHNWANELKQLSEHLPERERLHLNRLTFETKTQTGAAIVRASGAAREARDVSELTERLVASDRYALQPRSITPNSRDPLYRAGFELEAAVVDVPANGAEPSPNSSVDSSQRLTGMR